MHIALLGATGVLGRHVVPRLIERGHRVRAVVRAPADRDRLRAAGVDAVPGDILEAGTLPPAMVGVDAVLHLATAIPREGSAATWQLNDRIRREGTRNLLAAAAEGGVQRYVQQGITFIYGDHAPDGATESTPLRPAPLVQSAVDMEALVRASGLDAVILRGGAFYGPGTGRDDAWRQAARAGTLRMPADGEGFVSLIHVADMARAVVRAAEWEGEGRIFNVVDDQPVTWRELLGYVAAHEGVAPPVPGGRAELPSLAVANEAIKTILGWVPAFPTYRAGLAS